MLLNDHFRDQFNEKIKACKECSLCDLEGPITGYGSSEPEVMFIADTPVQSDLKASVPFTGKGKELMIEVLKTAGLTKGDYYLTYMIKYVPTEKRMPNVKEYKDYGDILLKEIEIMNPKIIVSMGFFVTKHLIESYRKNSPVFSIKGIRGQGILIKKKTRGTRLLRPRRYLVPTWNPNTSNNLKIENIKSDAGTVKGIRDLGIILAE